MLTGNYKDWTVRPNMVFCYFTALFSDRGWEKRESADVLKKELLTSRGLRTLTPSTGFIKVSVSATRLERDLAYHQGTVWPWLLGHILQKGTLNSMVNQAFHLFVRFTMDLTRWWQSIGVGTISEIYDGDLQHAPRVPIFTGLERLLNCSG